MKGNVAPPSGQLEFLTRELSITAGVGKEDAAAEFAGSRIIHKLPNPVRS